MQTIYTWRGLAIADEKDSPKDIAWTWDGWDHAANDRNHLLESERLWRMVFPKDVIGPVIDALRKQRLEDCHADLQRLADYWKPEFLRVFGLPRVLRCRAFPKGKSHSQGTPVLTFVIREGVAFIVRWPRGKPPALRSFFFPECLVKGWALFAQVFERNAAEHYVDCYSRCNSKRLPRAQDRQHFVERKYEIDREIRFVSARQWGFESEEPGARWVGFDSVPPATTRLGDVDPPPKRRPGDLNARSPE